MKNIKAFESFDVNNEKHATYYKELCDIVSKYKELGNKTLLQGLDSLADDIENRKFTDKFYS